MALGAMGSLVPKLLQLLQNEYDLQKSVREKVDFLIRELESIKPALDNVSLVPWDELDKQVQIWACQVREASYDIEDVLDTFLVRVEVHEPVNQSRLKGALKKMAGVFGKLKTRHDISGAIEKIQKKVQEVADRRDRYKIDSIVTKPAPSTDVVPRLQAFYTKDSKLVGIIEPRDALIKKLSLAEDVDTFSLETKKISVVGFGGLGKTTLAKQVYNKVSNQFDCGAFVAIGRNPEHKKVLRDILIELINDGKKREGIRDPEKMYTGADRMESDVKQLTDDILQILERKRYCIVVDDIWDTTTWQVLNNCFMDNNRGSIIIATSRISQVCADIGEVYTMKELSDSQSRELLYTIAFGGEEKMPNDTKVAEVSDKFLQKCHGVPLVIITIASVLASKQIEEWSSMYDSIGFGHVDNTQVKNMEKILSFSYYDLPSYLRTCMLYVSVFPEDYFIERNMLIWRWIAEGLVLEEEDKKEFDVGNRYFEDLINRGMILPMERMGSLDGCRVHDMILHMIRNISNQQKFLAVRDRKQGSKDNIRRLSLHMSSLNEVYSMGMPQVRSFNAYNCHGDKIPPVSGFRFLRVLALEACIPLKGCLHTEHMAKLLHLRYLGLQQTPVRELPKEIGHLKFLQTLMLNETGIQELPSSMRKLTDLLCLRADKMTRVPDWIGKLTSLIELEMYPGADDKCFVKELGKLRGLRALKTRISLQGEGQVREFEQSLINLQMLETMIVERLEDSKSSVVLREPPNLFLHANVHVLKLEAFTFPRVPESIHPKALPNLDILHLQLRELDQQDIELLGRFKKLYSLFLSAGEVLPPCIICGGGFQNLKSFVALFYPPMFVHGAMPSLETIMLHIPVRDVKVDNPCLDFGLRNLSSLEDFTAGIFYEGCLPIELVEVAAAIRHAVDMHPNRPAVSVVRIIGSEDKMVKSDDISQKNKRNVLRVKKLTERVDYQKKLHTSMRDEAFSMAEQITDLKAKNKMKEYGEQIHDTLGRVEQELEADIISRVANDSSGMERAVEIFTIGYRRLATMLEDLRTAPSLQASMIEKVKQQIQKLKDQIDVQNNYNNSAFYSEVQEVANSITKDLPKISKPASASLPEPTEILTDKVESMDDPSSSNNQQIKHISGDNNVEVEPAEESLLSIAILDQLLRSNGPSKFASSSALRVLDLLYREFTRMPSWINPQNLPDLCELQVMVSADVDEKDLGIIGGLPQLRKLVLLVLREHRFKLTICGCSGFQNLKSLDIGVLLRFQPGAMPSLEYINFNIQVAEFKDANISLDFGLENLLSLQTVKANISCETASPREVEEVEAAIRHALHGHPNHPALDIRRVEEDKMGPVDAAPRKLYRMMYKILINNEIKKLNGQIEDQNNENSTHWIQEGNPSSAKIDGSSSASQPEIETLQNQLAGIEGMEKGCCRLLQSCDLGSTLLMYILWQLVEGRKSKK